MSKDLFFEDGDDYGNDSGNDMGGDVWSSPQQDNGNQDAVIDCANYSCDSHESITDSILGIPTDESNVGGPIPQEIYVNGRYLTVNLDGTVTTFDDQIVCTVNSFDVGTIMADDIRILTGLEKIK